MTRATILAEPQTGMNEQLTLAAFQENLGTEFRVLRPEAKPVTLELIDVRVGQCTPNQEQFSVSFAGPADSGLGQGSFRLEHERMGVIDLFLVPFGMDRNQIQYEAVFNRFHPENAKRSDSIRSNRGARSNDCMPNAE